MAHSKPLMAHSSGTDPASAAVAVGPAHARYGSRRHRRDLGRLAGPARAGLHRRRRADPRRQGPRHRHRARQVRPCRAQDRGDAGLHRHAGLLRARRRSQPWRSRHDHAGRRHHRAVVVRRAAGDEEPRQLFQPLRDSDDRGHLQRRLLARRGRAHRAGTAEGARGLSAQSGADHLVADAGRDRRRARHRAARGPRLHRAGIRQFPSRRQARRDAEIRPRHHAYRRRHPGQTARRQDVGRAGGDVDQGLRLRLHRRRRRRDRRHHHRRRSAPPHAPRSDDGRWSTRS